MVIVATVATQESLDIQTDNDSSFGAQDLAISHRHILAASPGLTSKVARSYKTNIEEFYRGRKVHDKKDLARKLRRWEKEYQPQTLR